MSTYRTLHDRFRRIELLREANSLISWDMATIMPDGSAEGRGEQIAALDLTIHETLTDARLGDWLASAETDNTLDDWQRANVHEMRRQYVHATAVPADLVEARSIATNKCEIAWRTARPENDFEGLRPYLETVLKLVRETGQAKAAVLGCSVYDALLDQYEPDGRSADIDRVFSELGTFLPDLIQGAIDAQAKRPAPLRPEGPFPIERQRELGVKLMTALGFDFNRGRLDVSHHPFCGGTSQDVRITTRYNEDDFGRALMGVLHETGHALYEFGLPADWRYQPVGKPRGMSLHESQSLLIEMQACRGAEFLTFAAPLIREAFGRKGAAFEADNLYRINTRVSRGLIRIDADEVTYPAHVILRYRLERAMVGGDLSIADLPGAWNELMQELIGIVPPDHRDGCLQDIHWPCGAWGYFPTYTLGAMSAAQLFAAAKRDVPTIPSAITEGDFTGLLGWLRANVHGKGSAFSTQEILTQATGSPLDAGIYRRHLEQRYLA